MDTAAPVVDAAADETASAVFTEIPAAKVFKSGEWDTDSSWHSADRALRARYQYQWLSVVSHRPFSYFDSAFWLLEDNSRKHHPASGHQSARYRICSSCWNRGLRPAL